MTVLANHTMATAIIHLIVFHIIHGLLGSSGSSTPMEGRHSSALLSLVSHQVSSAHPLLSALQIATYV